MPAERDDTSLAASGARAARMAAAKMAPAAPAERGTTLPRLSPMFFVSIQQEDSAAEGPLLRSRGRDPPPPDADMRPPYGKEARL